MPWARARYDDVRPEIKPGDVIAFGGKGGFTGVIKWATVGAVSHVAVVLPPDPRSSATTPEGPSREGVPDVRIIESLSSMDKFPGVGIHSLAERIEIHEGEVWWLRLDERTRQKLDSGRFHDFLRQQVGTPYDSLQALRSAPDLAEDVPIIRLLTRNVEDFSKFFCSELVAAGLEAGRAIGSINCSEVTPMDLCGFAIYRDTYYQFKGDRKLIDGFNTYDPEGWGEQSDPMSFGQMLYNYPALLGLIISGVLLLGLLIQEVLLGRFAVVFGPTGSPRDFRLAIIHCLLAGYLPSACLFLVRGVRTTFEELEGILRPADDASGMDPDGRSQEEPSRLPIGTISTIILIFSGVMGLLLTVLTPILTVETGAWDPSTWSPEVWWHRLVGLFIGWWVGWFFLAVWHTSTQTSRLAARIGSLDLLDLSPLSPFVRQGLLTSLLAVGAASLASLFLLEPGQGPVVAIAVGLSLPMAILGLLLPVRGAHRRISQVKNAELEWTRERIRLSRSSVYDLSEPQSPGQMADLIAYLQLIEDVPEWPIQSSALVQVALYLLIPVVSWLGSLLIENLLGHFIG
ncbi:hypothetical protein ACFLTC_00715 [Chloroflexota bacterium]